MFDKILFAKTLRKIRKQNKLSVKDVSYLCAQYGYPIYFKSIYKWEKAESVPDLRSLEVLSYIYNTNFFDLLRNEKSKKYTLSINETNFINMLRFDKKYKKALILLTNYKGGIS